MLLYLHLKCFNLVRKVNKLLARLFYLCENKDWFYYFYSNYPEKRYRDDSEGVREGVIGSLTQLHSASLSSQPISSFDWSPDKMGLGVCTSFDQTIRVIIATKLNSIWELTTHVLCCSVMCGETGSFMFNFCNCACGFLFLPH